MCLVWYMAVQSHGGVWSVGVLCVMFGCDVGVGVDAVSCCLAEEGEGGGEEEEEEDEPEFFTVLYFWQVHVCSFACSLVCVCVCLSVCLSTYCHLPCAGTHGQQLRLVDIYF